MSLTASLASQLSTSADSAALAELASKAIEEGEEERALTVVGTWRRGEQRALLWQWNRLGTCDRWAELEAALASFADAAGSHLRDVSVAHGMRERRWKLGWTAAALRAARGLARATPNLLGMARRARRDGRRGSGDRRAPGGASYCACLAFRSRAIGPVDGRQTGGRPMRIVAEEALARFPTAQPMCGETLLNVQRRRGAYETWKRSSIAQCCWSQSPSSGFTEGPRRGIRSRALIPRPVARGSDQENRPSHEARPALLRVGEIAAAARLKPDRPRDGARRDC